MDSWTLLNLSQFVATFSTGLIQRDAPRTGRVHHQWNSPLQIVGQGEWPNPPGFNVRMGARKMSEREPMGTNGNHLGTIWDINLIDSDWPVLSHILSMRSMHRCAAFSLPRQPLPRCRSGCLGQIWTSVSERTWAPSHFFFCLPVIARYGYGHCLLFLLL